jgi:hypothetical protein
MRIGEIGIVLLPFAIAPVDKEAHQYSKIICTTGLELASRAIACLRSYL